MRLYYIAFLFLAILAVIFGAPVACTAPRSATKALVEAGYSDVKITGFRYFSCDKDDWFHTGFSAKGPTGVPVTGTVCAGFLKGNTIRLD
jgi:hypothetical protein